MAVHLLHHRRRRIARSRSVWQSHAQQISRCAHRNWRLVRARVQLRRLNALESYAYVARCAMVRRWPRSRCTTASRGRCALYHGFNGRRSSAAGVHTGEQCEPAHFSLAEILVLAGTAEMAPPVNSTFIVLVAPSAALHTSHSQLASDVC